MVENFSSTVPNIIVGLASLVLLVVVWFTVIFVRKRNKMNIGRAVLEAAKIPFFKTSLMLFTHEIARARRNKIPFTILIFKFPKEAKTTKFQRKSKIVEPLDFLLCGRNIKSDLRLTDVIAYDHKNNQYIILLPETKKSEVSELVKRLLKSIPSRIASLVTYNTAEFPGDGLIIDELILAAAPVEKLDFVNEFNIGVSSDNH